MRRNYEFVQLDVFTRTALTGNPLAIFADGGGLTDGEMQALAREMNLSETTFILPREPQIEAKEGKRVRIFTVTEELPFAGHPTLGTALYIYSTSAERAAQVVLDLNIGKVPVQFRSDTDDARFDRVDGAVFGEMRQRDPEFGNILPREKVAASLGLAISDIASQWPIQVVSTGLAFAILPISNLESFRNLKFNPLAAEGLLVAAGARFFYLICVEPARAEVRARMFFYGGEDPATGSAAGCAASWLVKHKLVKSDEQVLIRQGVEAGRPSELFIRATKDGERVTNVRVGGYAVEVLRGTVTL
jgi:trans-2,3-dihydro-3-hydroxyanthranilate isomerase